MSNKGLTYSPGVQPDAPFVTGTIDDVKQAVAGGIPQIFVVAARIIGIERCNSNYVVLTHKNIALYIVLLSLINAEGIILEVKGIGNFVGTLFGVSASRFRQYEMNKNLTALAGI